MLLARLYSHQSVSDRFGLENTHEMHPCRSIDVHTPRLWSQEAFWQESDLRRHMRTIHNPGSRYPCIENGCSMFFPRKDLMMKHAREKHETFKCTINHCSVIVLSSQRDSHFQNFHGHYECTIGSCKLVPKSCFKFRSYLRHLDMCHPWGSIDYENRWCYYANIEQRRDTDTGEVVSRDDCEACLARIEADGSA